MSFLEQTAKQIWAKHHTEVSDQLFLFPSRRSMLYFKRAITEAAGQNLWMPDCLTLEKWILDQSENLNGDNITLSFQLYQSARDVKFTSQSFEMFYPLAQVILNDFEEVDMALIDTNRLWRHTASWQNIAEQESPPDIWKEMTDTPLKEKWVVNWNALNTLHTHFRQRLDFEKISSKGQIYRSIVDDLENIPTLEYSHIHVIGFSILTRAEVKIMDFFQANYSISFYWFTPPQMALPGLDAGKNVIKWADHFGQNLEASVEAKPEIKVINAGGMVAQMKAASQILSEAKREEEQMAVLLPHPSLIDLFLRSFPDNLSRVNVSLGYPLIYSPVRALIEWILSLWEVIELNDGQMNRQDLERIWSHIYISNYVQKQHVKIPDSRQLYFYVTDFEGDESALSQLYKPLDHARDALDRLMGFLDDLIFAQTDIFHREILRYTIGRLIRLNDVLSRVKDISIVFLKRIINEMFQTASVPFRGEPMKGVQVLGIQEVQNLAFETLIIPGMNEEILPSGKIKSLIPYSLRRYYGLWDQGDLHTVQSYYIWTAMLQANQVFLLYSQGDDLLGAKGLSRYVFQLKYGGVDIPVEERFLDFDLDGFEAGSKEILMNTEQEVLLRKYLQEHGLSPTALMSYIRCPFQFFLRYVLSIKEDDSPTLGLDYRHMGTVIHDVMYAIYEPWQGKEISAQDLKAIKREIGSITHARYCRLYPKDSPESLKLGMHWVEQEIIVRAVNHFLDYDAKVKGLQIEMLEADLVKEISTSQINHVRLQGKIDRLDRNHGKFRVIDYKTGSSHLITNKSLAKLWEEQNPSHNWQLFFYAYLLKDHIGEVPFEMGHYTLKEKKLYVPLKSDKRSVHTSQDFDHFESVLKDIINSMVDPEIPFQQTTNVKHCEYCVFNTFCERQGSY